MKSFPPLKTCTFADLAPGDLFAYSHHKGTSLALKTEPSTGREPHNLVVLGPAFPYDVEESFLIGFPPDEVISYGKTWTVILPSDPSAWFSSGSKRESVCLALSGSSIYICTNGGHSPSYYDLRLVECTTGKVMSRHLPSDIAFTRQWEIVFMTPNMPPQSVLKFPTNKPTA